MHRYILPILFFAAFISGTSAQTTTFRQEPLLFKAYYHFVYKYDTNDTTRKFDKEMVLHIGKTMTAFRSAATESTAPLPDFVLNPPILPVSMNKMETGQENEEVSIDLRSRFNEDVNLYSMPAKGQFVQITRLGYNDFRVEIPIPKIKWDITEETKLLDSIPCQKATGEFGGRTYTAWFAPSIPFSYGPWKLSGLPGLILEASDDKNEIQFTFNGAVSDTKDQYLIFEELHPAKLSENELKKTKEKFYKDPVAMTKAQLGANAIISEITFLNEKGITVRGNDALEAIEKESKIRITNPMELKKENQK